MHTNTMQKAPGACDSKGLHFASHGPIQQAHGGNKPTPAKIKTIQILPLAMQSGANHG
jgi:hypothetical protein